MSQINVTTIRNRTGGPPSLDQGVVVGAAATFSSTVSIAGTLTYEDVTNIDSVGIVTARGGFEIGASGVGGTITSAGNLTVAGDATFAGTIQSGGNPNSGTARGTSINEYGTVRACQTPGSSTVWEGYTKDTGTTTSSITAAGAATFAGSVKIGGTAAANEIDEYEEGTWTPSQGAGITLVGTFSSGGDYIKIGNLVHLTGWVQGSTSIAVSAGAAVFTGGLPFNIKAGGDEMRYDFIVGSGGVTGGGYAWNESFYTYSMTTSISATSQKIFFQLTYSVLA